MVYPPLRCVMILVLVLLPFFCILFFVLFSSPSPVHVRIEIPSLVRLSITCENLLLSVCYLPRSFLVLFSVRFLTSLLGCIPISSCQIISSDVSVDPWNKLGDVVVLGHNSRNLESMCTASPMHPVTTSYGGVSLWIPSLLSKSGECSQRDALASGGCFLYMQGQRWIVDDSVMQVSMDIVRSPDDEIGFWVLSEMGISRIESRRLRLSDKASLFQGRVRPCSWRLKIIHSSSLGPPPLPPALPLRVLMFKSVQRLNIDSQLVFLVLSLSRFHFFSLIFYFF